MALTVLSDSDIHQILVSLNKDDIVQLQTNLSEALHDYSKGTQESAGCSINQPKRLIIPGPDGRVTLVMPASTNTSRGIKTVSLQCGAKASPTSSMSNLSLKHSSSHDSTTNPMSPSSASPSRASSMSNAPSLSHSSTNSSTNDSTQVDPSTFSAQSGASSISSAPSTSSSTSSNSLSTSPHGSLTLLALNGTPSAFLSAKTLTAFRTALASTIIFSKREKVHSITVFGAGRQALWHIRLALLLKGSQIHHIDIVNRSFARAKQLMNDYYTLPEWEAIRKENPKLQFSILSAGFKDRDVHLKEHVRKADAIFLCTPSTEPLFPHEILTHSEGRRKGRYLAAIGSYRPHMQELHPEILRHAVVTHTHNHSSHSHHHHRHAESHGVIIVDSLEASLKEAGEIIEAGIKPKQLVEVGELMMVKKASMKEIEMGVGEGEKGLRDWLMKGNVVYKSVGLGLMDVCVGEDLVRLAREKGVGGVVEGF